MAEDTEELIPQEGKGSGKFMYWRKVNGEITIGPAWDVEYRRQSKKGMTPLEAYGEFGDNPKVWDIRMQPYKRILAKGGAKEFTVAQILELGWHRKAPYSGVTFPQLEGVEHKDHICNFCGKALNKEQDLNRHQSVAHKEISSQTQLARLLAQATKEMAGGTSAATDAVIQSLSRLVEEMIGRQKEQDKQLAALQARLEKTQ